MVGKRTQKDLEVLVYFKLNTAVLQKNKQINKSQDNSGWKGAQEVSIPSPAQSRSSCEMRPGWFIQSGLENLQGQTLDSCPEQPVPHLALSSWGRSFSCHQQLSVFVHKVTFSQASPGPQASPQRATAPAPNHLPSTGPSLNFPLLNKKMRYLTKVAYCNTWEGTSVPYAASGEVLYGVVSSFSHCTSRRMESCWGNPGESNNNKQRFRKHQGMALVR